MITDKDDGVETLREPAFVVQLSLLLIALDTLVALFSATLMHFSHSWNAEAATCFRACWCSALLSVACGVWTIHLCARGSRDLPPIVASLAQAAFFAGALVCSMLLWGMIF